MVEKWALDEIMECLPIGHELYFLWRGEEYVIQPAEGLYLLYRPKPYRELFAVPLPSGQNLHMKEMVQRALNAKVLDGKSFLERRGEIDIEYIL